MNDSFHFGQLQFGHVKVGYNIYNIIITWEMFCVKIFSSLAHPTKIYHTKGLFLATNKHHVQISYVRIQNPTMQATERAIISLV